MRREEDQGRVYRRRAQMVLDHLTQPHCRVGAIDREYRCEAHAPEDAKTIFVIFLTKGGD